MDSVGMDPSRAQAALSGDTPVDEGGAVSAQASAEASAQASSDGASASAGARASAALELPSGPPHWLSEAISSVEHAPAALRDDLAAAEQTILSHEEPANTSGYTPPPPSSSLATGALNILETAAVRIGSHIPVGIPGVNRPFKTYTAWVDQGVLMRGSEQDGKGFAALKQQGVRTVVNLRLENNDERSTVEGLGMKAVQIPSYDQAMPSHDEVQGFLDTVRDPANRPVYVHCQQGVGRTGIMAAAWRIAGDGWTADQAIAEARQMGMKSSDQEAFIRQFAADYAAGRYH